MKRVLEELRRRRLPQAVGLYLGVSWGLLQFVDWVVRRYLLAGVWVDAVLVVSLSLAPAVLLLAYTHGAPGKDSWGRVEKIGVPANLALTAVLLLSLLHGRELGATAHKVTVTDEEGRRVERVVPKEDFRRKLAIFFWDGVSGDPELAWLRYGLAEMLAADLEQNPYLDVWTPYDGWERSFFSHLVRAGYEDGLGVPLALQRRVAESFHLHYFVDGELRRLEDGRLELHAAIYRTKPARRVAEKSAAAGDPLELVDRLAPEIAGELEIPAGSERLASDLPVAERLSGSIEAVRAYVEGRTAVLLHNDREAAIASWQRAVELDPTFAAAHLQLARSYAENGEMDLAKESIREALQHDYKLSPKKRLVARANDYYVRGEIQKSTAVYEMAVELDPTDTEALAYLANSYRWAGNRVEDALTTYRRLYEIDPEASWTLLQIGELEIVRGEVEKALVSYRRYAELHPDEPTPWMKIGDLHRRRGDLDEARESFERASLLANGLVSPLLALADLDLREGELEAFEERLEEATAIASTPQAESAVVRAEIEGLELRGQLRRAVERMERLIEVQSRYRSPLNVIGDVEVFLADLQVLAGRREEALERMEELRGILDPPFDRFADFGELAIHLAAGDEARAEPHLERAAEFISEQGRDDLRYLVEHARGRILELQGRHRDAFEVYRHAFALFSASVQSTLDLQLAVELQTAVGRSARRAGELESAEERLRTVLLRFPSYPEAHLELARLAVDTDRAELARSHIRSALAMWRNADPDYPPARDARQLAAELGVGVPG